ncbi:mitochondrial 54S ribosomal protein L40 [bacterium]|nr:MAG: mitochondrial 54S ribosomal protein L40 [bacterium]
MAKKAPAKQPPNRLLLIVGGLSVLGAVVWSMTDSPPAPTVARKKTTKTAAADKSGFIPEDYTAKFEPVKTLASNVFKPLVIKETDPARGVASIPTRDGSLPEAFTGEAGWAYTGYVEIDGRPQALLENDKTGDAVYVRAGAPFKKAKILAVTEDEIVVQGPNRITRTVKLGGQEEPEVAPSAPAITGPIVNPNLSVQPLPSPNGLQPGFNNNPNQGQPRPRRGGGGRRNNAPN